MSRLSFFDSSLYKTEISILLKTKMYLQMELILPLQESMKSKIFQIDKIFSWSCMPLLVVECGLIFSHTCLMQNFQSRTLLLPFFLANHCPWFLTPLIPSHIPITEIDVFLFIAHNFDRLKVDFETCANCA